MRTSKILFLMVCMLRASSLPAQVMQVGVTNMAAPGAAAPTFLTQVLQFTASTGGATTTVSTNFQAKAAIISTWAKTSTGESNGASWSYGFTDGTSYTSIAWAGDNAASTSNIGKSWQTAKALSTLTNGTPTNNVYITGVAFNSTPNIVVTFSGTPASAYLINVVLFGGSGVTAYVGTANMRTTTGTLSVTAPNFQGNAAFFIATHSLSPALGVNASPMMGFAISSTKRWVANATALDAQTGTAITAQSTVWSGDAIYTRYDNTTQDLADFTGFTSTGFDLNFTNTTAGDARQFGYLVIKGGQWDCGVSVKPTTATTQTVTGSAIHPQLAGWYMNANVTNGTSVAPAVTEFGASDGTNQNYAGAYHNNTTNTVAISAGDATHVLHEMAATANAAFTSFNADGWTITWDATGTAFQMPWWTVSQ